MSIKWTNDFERRISMRRDTKALRGKVIEEYGTVCKFASAIGWSNRKASYIAAGKQVMTAQETEDCAKALHIDNARDFMRIFYPHVSIKWTDEKGA